MITIDAHHHFWDPARGDYDWLTPDMTSFWRVFGPEDLHSQLGKCAVNGTVVVQAAPTDAECNYLLEIADRTPWVLGVVGWLDMQSAHASERVAACAVRRKFVGVRPMLQNLADIDWITQAPVIPVFRALVAANLTFDALIRVHQASHIAAIAARHSDLAIVVDHAAKPDIARSERTHWGSAMRLLANHSNIVCKLSGLLTEARPGAGAESLRFYVDALLEIFGPQRLLWGSDWPMFTPLCGYQSWITLTHHLLQDLSSDSRADVMGRNAIAFYGLNTI